MGCSVKLLAAYLFKEEESVIGRGRDETSESKRVATQVNLLCISTLHISLGKSGAARCIRERVYKNTSAIVRSRIMFQYSFG